jgi:hypothetical protein
MIETVNDDMSMGANQWPPLMNLKITCYLCAALKIFVSC